MRDAVLLSVGTLTALPVPAPRQVTPGSARDAVLVAPLAVLPLAVVAVAVAAFGDLVGLSAPVLALLFVAVLALGSRALHWDGLSDTVDGLTASYDAARSLEVMKSGTSGPAGVLATVLVAGLQVAALSTLLTSAAGMLLAGLLVCLSRAALTLTCLRGVPPARRDGMGQPLAGVVPLAGAAAVWVTALVATTGVLIWAGAEWWRGPVAVLTAILVVLVLLRRATRRFGGVTGDVYGAGVELALTALLLAVPAL